MPRHHVVDFSARIKRAQNKSSSEVGVARRRRRNRQIHESCGDWPEASVLLFVDSRKPARFYGRIERSVIYPTRDSPRRKRTQPHVGAISGHISKTEDRKFGAKYALCAYMGTMPTYLGARGF